MNNMLSLPTAYQRLEKMGTELVPVRMMMAPAGSLSRLHSTSWLSGAPAAETSPSDLD